MATFSPPLMLQACLTNDELQFGSISSGVVLELNLTSLNLPLWLDFVLKQEQQHQIENMKTCHSVIKGMARGRFVTSRA